MRFLIDANLPRSAIGTLTARGHDVEFARDIGLAAAPDAQIAERARQTEAALLTRDLDFSDVRRYPPEKYGGIVVLRLPDHFIAAEIVVVLERFLAEPRFVESLPGRLAIVDENRVRFRPPVG
jgi:predicted nuclease of predicted toxin-antitoxin system